MREQSLVHLKPSSEANPEINRLAQTLQGHAIRLLEGTAIQSKSLIIKTEGRRELKLFRSLPEVYIDSKNRFFK